MRGPHSGISPLLRWHSFGMPCQSRSSIPSISAIVACRIASQKLHMYVRDLYTPKFKNLQPNCHISTSQALEKDSKKVSHEHALFPRRNSAGNSTATSKSTIHVGDRMQKVTWCRWNRGAIKLENRRGTHPKNLCRWIRNSLDGQCSTHE